jgi:hypothetical protein
LRTSIVNSIKSGKSRWDHTSGWLVDKRKSADRISDNSERDRKAKYTKDYLAKRFIDVNKAVGSQKGVQDCYSKAYNRGAPERFMLR